MASTAFDLDRWDESATLARSAVSYAALVGNASLQAWTLGLAALLANWRNEPDTALRHFRQGIQVAPTREPRKPGCDTSPPVPMPCWETLALSPRLSIRHAGIKMTPSSTATRCARRPAANSRSAAARAEACAAAAWLDLGHGQEAKDAAQRALNDLTALPAGRQPVSQVTGARIDLATACLMQRELDEAEDALGQRVRHPVAAQERLAVREAGAGPEEPSLPLLGWRSGSATAQ